ncbi:MAG TPA: RHS repeat-associated core domain-containing protein, partial [Ramlibacter sp.]
MRGVELVRQDRKGTSGVEQLLPLGGHLGTSLGAVARGGEIVEAVDGDSFGNLEGHQATLQTHIYTGEYWDPDAQLVYLRARWYAPQIGRFISADPFEGKQEDPLS